VVVLLSARPELKGGEGIIRIAECWFGLLFFKIKKVIVLKNNQMFCLDVTYQWKKDRIKCTDLCKDYSKEGLKMIDIDQYLNSSDILA
jgi:hypothetical protein